ncbi:putative protein serine/threonine kinase [Cavenderia fasciculata]|uniref:Protein kinase domain-containing protein n=1 Tax=Cavenderia fasciculata TaxID=261658 RepID=F4QBK7_CACFS|nr:putative protein serine/threonine kinase [Cavenderia fasciculata]EGG14595.1 putative protein serine/threonine kinase [Cavenderia fasciculata]|eukprot:XP_004351103.1 putative protein serine/threonine kinase [Cavenderia fasciculata]
MMYYTGQEEVDDDIVSHKQQQQQRQPLTSRITSLSSGSEDDEIETEPSLTETTADEDDDDSNSRDTNTANDETNRNRNELISSQQHLRGGGGGENYESIYTLIDSAKDILSEKKIMLKMILTDHIMNNGTQLDANRFSSFIRHVMSLELEGLSPAITQSKQFKQIFIDHYYRIFKQALKASNYDELLLPSNLLSIYNSSLFINQQQQQYLLNSPENPLFNKLNTARYQKEFIELNKLGSGGFGSVYLARNCLDNQNYAIKKVNFTINFMTSTGQGKVEKILREVKALAKLDHKNILRYYNAWIEFNTTPDHSGSSNLSSVEGSLETNATDDEESSLGKVEDFDDENSDLLFEDSSSHSSIVNDIFSFRSSNSNISISNNDQSSTNGYLDNSDESDQTDESSSSLEDSSADDSDESEEDTSFINFKKPNSPKGQIVPFNPHRLDVSQQYIPTLNNLAPTIYNPHINKLNNNQNNNSKIRYILYIQTQYCEGKTLREWIDTRDSNISIDTIYSIFKQIVTGLAHIHTNMIHRDLKPANIYLMRQKEKEDLKVIIGDFGLVKDLTIVDESRPENGKPNENQNYNDSFLEKSSNVIMLTNASVGVGTFSYSSPEIISGRPYSNKVDIYSLAIIFFELLYPFNTMSERSECIKNLKKGILPESFKIKFKYESELILKMMNIDPNERPSAEQLIKLYLPNILAQQRTTPPSPSPSLLTTPTLCNSKEIHCPHPTIDYNSMDKSTLIKLLCDRDRKINDLLREINDLNELARSENLR